MTTVTAEARPAVHQKGRPPRPSLRTVEERNSLVERWRWLPVWQARRSRLRRLTEDEAESAGFLGLLRAAELYDPATGHQFSTYALYWIKQAIAKDEADATLVHVPYYVQARKAKAKARYRSCAAVASVVMSLDRSLRGARDDLEPTAPVYDPVGDTDTRAALARALRGLSGRERAVIRLRFWDRLILSAIGARLGVTKERVRQIQAGAVEKLRAAMGAAG